MIFNLNSLDKSVSTKTKTTVLVLGMFFILSLFFLYLQYITTKEFILESQDEYENKVNSIFKESVLKTKRFYVNRGLANLNSYGIDNALNNDKDKLISLSKNRWEILKQENKFLKSMVFFDKSEKFLAYLGEEPASKNFENIDSSFKFSQETLTYQLVVPTPSENGYLLFIIDPLYFLYEIYHLANTESYILTKYKNEFSFISLKESKDKPLTINLLQNHNDVSNFFRIDKNNYITHRIKLDNVLGSENTEILFFQDITSGRDRLSQTIFKSFVLIAILGTFLFIVLHYGFKVLIDRLEESQKELSKLNKNLEIRVEKEVSLKIKKEKEANEKERLLIHQSKLASMGEMIGSIAHQWRQPLTQLGSILVYIELLFEKKKLNAYELRSSIEEAEEQIDFMSKTIDDFRNFFKPDKKKSEFSVNKSIEKSLTLISSSMENNHIKVNFESLDELFINGYENEFSQVILNILSNAKDVLLENKIKEPIINIIIQKDKEKVKVQICDNAGGVKLNPIEKVFEPYVSTKHASSGTGIGLYMSKNIIEKSMEGVLLVTNEKDGACFTILI